MIDFLRNGIAHTLVDVYNSGTDPVLHPEGFAQIQLDPPVGNWKLHVWSDHLPRAADVDVVHDHTWRLTSTVLRGKQVNCLYLEDDEGLFPGGVNYDLYVARNEIRHSNDVSTAGGKQLVRENTVRLIETSTLTIAEGDSYTMGARIFHKSLAEPGTVTLMQKSSRRPLEPRVAALPGQRPDGGWGEGDIVAPSAGELIDIMIEVLGE
jgi:hypothetical protein